MALSRGKRAGELSEYLLCDHLVTADHGYTHSPKEVTSVLPAYWEGIRYLMKRESKKCFTLPENKKKLEHNLSSSATRRELDAPICECVCRLTDGSGGWLEAGRDPIAGV
ncbi:hypothetical protein EVAR_98171_1 [Eumeta japonica]|uniref:Uncharacterized protein n=1 Tax=Eumeta variegata TaxID=151549 RepID=A0A4C1YIG7_EUMVA|nr:hypothetical protein EVAR_98171_1 [Eumeta japonica]